MQRSVDRSEPMRDDPSDGPESWVDRHGDGLYGYALLRLRSPDLAADLVQETFLEALRSRESFAGRSSERTWLVGILRHKILDHFRKGARRAARESREAPPAPAPPDEFDRRGRWKLTPAEWRGDPSRDLENREFWEVVQGCIGKLPAGLADAFFLRELDGLSADETEQVLGITPANLWTRLHRARTLLRRCLESGWFGDRKTTPVSVAKGPPPR